MKLPTIYPNSRSGRLKRQTDELGYPNAEGRWEKDFAIDKGVRNQDPRWELALHFGPGGKFSYLSRSTTEVRLTDGDARPMVSEVAVSARWSVNTQSQVVIEPDRAPAGREWA